MMQPIEVQVTLDCADPHELAAWWAETLGWELEPTDEGFIRQMIEAGQATEADTRQWRGELWWESGAALRLPDAGAVAGCRRMLCQKVPEGKTVKNRMHLDLRVEAAGGDLDAAREALLARGAAFLYEASQGPFRWYTMTDPEGNEFCLG